MPDPSTFRQAHGRPEQRRGAAHSGPDWRSEIRARLKDVRLSPARESEIVEELSQHLDERWRSLVAGGASPEEAAREARRAFSDRNVLAPNLAVLRQAHWTDPSPPAATRAVSLEGLSADARQAVRALRASPFPTPAPAEAAPGSPGSSEGSVRRRRRSALGSAGGAGVLERAARPHGRTRRGGVLGRRGLRSLRARRRELAPAARSSPFSA